MEKNPNPVLFHFSDISQHLQVATQEAVFKRIYSRFIFWTNALILSKINDIKLLTKYTKQSWFQKFMP